MNEHTNPEPLWVGMDVDAELARYRDEDRALKAPPAVSRPAHRHGRGRLRSALGSLGRGPVPPPRLAV
jgi:hypothetical protein